MQRPCVAQAGGHVDYVSFMQMPYSKKLCHKDSSGYATAVKHIQGTAWSLGCT